MPIYEYACNKCNHVFSVLKLTSGSCCDRTVCPQCGSEDVRKMVSAFSCSAPSGGGVSFGGGGHSHGGG